MIGGRDFRLLFLFFLASVAKKEGYEQIAAIFEAAANLLHAAEGENHEWTDMKENY